MFTTRSSLMAVFVFFSFVAPQMVFAGMAYGPTEKECLATAIENALSETPFTRIRVNADSVEALSPGGIFPIFNGFKIFRAQHQGYPVSGLFEVEQVVHPSEKGPVHCSVKNVGLSEGDGGKPIFDLAEWRKKNPPKPTQALPDVGPSTGQKDLCFSQALKDALSKTPYSGLELLSHIEYAVTQTLDSGHRYSMPDELDFTARDGSGREYGILVQKEFAQMGKQLHCRVTSAVIQSKADGQQVFDLQKWRAQEAARKSTEPTQATQAN